MKRKSHDSDAISSLERCDALEHRWHLSTFASVPRAALPSRDAAAKIPYFSETISCLTLIIGASCDSGLDLRLDGSGRNHDCVERFSGEFLAASQIHDQG